MASPRIHRFIAALALLAASQLTVRAQDNTTATAATDDKLTTAGDGVRPADTAEPVTPRERPRLQDNEVVSLKRRLEVHGGMSLTMGWASGGRNFREVGAWTSFFDPQSGFGMGFGISRLSGDVPYDYGYGFYPGGYYGGRGGLLYGAAPGTTYDVDLFWVRPNFSLSVGFSQTEYSGRPLFDGTGYGLRRHY